nr:zinc finger, CCHC-type [Tanacetum cinerariifolium]
MDTRLSNIVMGIPITSTRGLLLSKPYQPHYSLSTSKSSDMHLIKSNDEHGVLVFFIKPTIETLKGIKADHQKVNDNKGQRKHQDTKANPKKKSKLTCWKCRKPERLKKDCRGGKAANKANGSGTNGSVDGFTNSLKDQNMFNKSIQTKRKLNLNYLKVWGCMAVVRLPDIKLKTLGKKGIECIFVGYDEHSKAFTLYVIEPNDLVSVNSIIKTMDAIFNENRFSLVPRPSLEIPNRNDDIGGSMVPKEVTEVVQQHKLELRKSKMNRTLKNSGPKFLLYLIEGTRQKSGIDYFETYAPVVRISTIILQIAMASIHNLILHQMYVKIAFLNGELDIEVYMNQPQGFIMSGNENKTCKPIKSLYGLWVL